MMTAEFNVLKIVKNLRDIKILLKAKGIMSKYSKIQAANSGGNIIVLDTESDQDSSSDDEKELY